MRHGATEWNLNGIIMGGNTDIPLHEIGIQEAHSAVITHNDDITHVFYSPLQRTLQTMGIVTQHMNCPKEALPGVQEQHIGELAEKPRQEYLKGRNAPPGGESWAQFRQRVVRSVKHGLVKSDCPLFIAHGGVFRALTDALKIEHTSSLNNCELVKFVPCSESHRWQIIRIYTAGKS